MSDGEGLRPPLRVAVVGVGLMGGSVALAARERLGATVAGWDPDPAALAAARQRGALDDAASSLEAAVAGADVVVAAAPIPALEATVRAALAAAGDGCVVTDVGSTKRALAEAFDDPRFVGGHPLAGGESGGVDHARAELFDGATWYLTPRREAGGVLLERLHRFVAGLGARPQVLDPETHDRLMASVSHLPHVVANVLVAQAARALGGERMPATGPSFRDATRVAGANPAIWPGIYLANRDALAAAIDETVRRLTAVRDALANSDEPALARWQAGAAQERRSLLETGLAGGPTRELRFAVPNRPGVIADLALTLAEAGINISDMSLSPSPDNTSGQVALWVAERDAERAAALIVQRGLAVA